jgi:hypothetical protein
MVARTRCPSSIRHNGNRSIAINKIEHENEDSDGEDDEQEVRRRIEYQGHSYIVLGQMVRRFVTMSLASIEK